MTSCRQRYGSLAIDKAPERAAPSQRVVALEAEVERLRAALAVVGQDASEARTATVAAEGATRTARADAATAAAGHARDMAVGRAELADSNVSGSRS